MFSFHKLEIVHWDWWERFSLPLDANIVTVVGPNGSGKTTLLDALRVLLTIPCSNGRDFKRYVRRADRPYAWLRAVVSNPRRANGQLAFWPITDERVTLFCRIRKDGGEWKRSYGIGRGDISVEEAETAEAVNWVGLRQYESQLEGAGLTRAIKRVLALDQGHTDKLCELNGRELLSLVFEVFGDKDVLDNYQKAREDQTACQRELDELTVQLASLHTRLRAAESDVSSYREYQRLFSELAELTSQWRPRVQLAELSDSLRGSRTNLVGKRREHRELQRTMSETEATHAALTTELAQAAELESTSKLELDRAQKAEKDFAKQLRKPQGLVDEHQRLLDRAARQAEGLDVEAATRDQNKLSRRSYELDAQIEALGRERDELRQRVAALESGRRPEPAEVVAFRAALQKEGIAHRMLADIVEITDESWQPAIEAVLAGVRQLVLLEKPEDRGRAWKLGEQHRYRHYVVPDRAPAPSARSGSLLECLRFTADPPSWLVRLLDGIQRVDSTDEGARLPESQAWITPRGYQRERRGGRDISVADVHFGRNAAAQARTRLLAIEDEAAGLREARQSVAQKLSAVQMALAGLDATRELAARAAEFEAATAELERLTAEAQALESARADAATRYFAAVERTKPLGTQHALAEEKLQRARKAAEQIDFELRRTQRAYVEHVLSWRSLRSGKPLSWRSDAGLAQTRAKFESVAAVEREIDRQEKRKAETNYVTDPQCIPLRDKLFAEHQQLESRMDDQHVHLDRARNSTDRARSTYIGVLRATLRRYASNLRSLGALAGIDVEVKHPELSNDDLSLAQARLEVQFNFDQKGMIGLNDGEASGGQQVMKSMILLVGLMAEDDKGGGFVFIDEPFAHLDIFNIDKVGAFLQATRAQYIVTTPNTHNVNVFKPSELTLVTQKKRGGMSFAPPIAFLRRAVG
ncbi:AAA family ATPase [Hydrocarboniphaga effusa]|uniref:AAA family ATPase n=1 Tax=Hydrocarboniphaga effusa TaxID=243629 RepID=UPI003BAC82FD